MQFRSLRVLHVIRERVSERSGRVASPPNNAPRCFSILTSSASLKYAAAKLDGGTWKKCTVRGHVNAISWNLKVQYRINNSWPPVPTLRHIQSMPQPTSLRSILILSSHLRLGLPTKPCTNHYCLSHASHTLPISCFLIWSPEYRLVRSTDNKAPRYVAFSTLLLLRPCYVQISSAPPLSNILHPIHPPSSERETRVHSTHTITSEVVAQVT